MHLEQVPADSHFFDDLGADSLVMAHFCARVRKRADLPSVSIGTSTGIRRSAACQRRSRKPRPCRPARRPAAPAEVAAQASTREYIAVRNAAVAGLSRIRLGRRAGRRLGLPLDLGRLRLRRHLPAGGPVRRRGLRGAVHPADPGEMGAHRPVEAAADPHLEPGLRPVLDRQDAGPVEPAGLPDRRLAAVRAVPEGAGRQGRARRRRSSPTRCPCAPTCSPSARARSSARTPSSSATGRRAGWIQTGAVSLGRDVFVGEKTVLDINTSIGDGAQLGHASALHSGQAVPAGERWHGSPAQRTDVNYARVAAGPLRPTAPVLVLRRHRGVRVLPVPAAGRGRRVPAADRGAAGWARCWIPAWRSRRRRSTSTRWPSPWWRSSAWCSAGCCSCSPSPAC